MITQLTIAKKLYIVFGLIIAINVSYGWYSLNSIENQSNYFSNYRQTARQSLLSAQLLELLMQARVSVLKYRMIPSEQQRYYANVKDNFDTISDKKEEIAELFEKDSSGYEGLQSVINNAAKYWNTFQEGVRHQEAIDILTKKQAKLVPGIKNRIERIERYLMNQGDYRTASSIAKNLPLFVPNPTPKQFDTLAQYIEKAPYAITSDSVLMDDIKQYRSTSNAMLQHISTREANFVEGLDTIGPLITSALHEVMYATIKRQDTIGPQMYQSFENTRFC